MFFLPSHVYFSFLSFSCMFFFLPPHVCSTHVCSSLMSSSSFLSFSSLLLKHTSSLSQILPLFFSPLLLKHTTSTCTSSFFALLLKPLSSHVNWLTTRRLHSSTSFIYKLCEIYRDNNAVGLMVYLSLTLFDWSF